MRRPHDDQKPTALPVDDLPLFTPPEKLGKTFDPVLDGARLATCQARVLALMLDGHWQTTHALRAVGGLSGDRRLRALRDPELGGLVVEAERDPNSAAHTGVWRYRISPDTTPGQLQRARAYLAALHPRGAE